MHFEWIEHDQPNVKYGDIMTPDEYNERTLTAYTAKASASISRNDKSSTANQYSSKDSNQSRGELNKNLAFLADYKTLEEIESDLYDLTRDYIRVMGSPKIRLDSIRHLHHLMQLQETIDELSGGERHVLQNDIETLLAEYPWVSNEYRWYIKAVGLINILAVKWGLISSHRYAYRSTAALPTNGIELGEHARRQTMVFTIDTLWLAVMCTMLPLCQRIDEASQAFSGFVIARFIGLVRYLISLNYSSDFVMYKSIKGFCGLRDSEINFTQIRKKNIRQVSQQRGFKVDGSQENSLPQYAGLITSEHIERAKRGLKPKVSSGAKKMRMKLAVTIGFHTLDLPANFCKCMDSKADAVNLKLRELLCSFEEAYRLFEYSTLKAQLNQSLSSFDLQDSKIETPLALE